MRVPAERRNKNERQFDAWEMKWAGYSIRVLIIHQCLPVTIRNFYCVVMQYIPNLLKPQGKYTSDFRCPSITFVRSAKIPRSMQLSFLSLFEASTSLVRGGLNSFAQLSNLDPRVQRRSDPFDDNRIFRFFLSVCERTVQDFETFFNGQLLVKWAFQQHRK